MLPEYDFIGKRGFGANIIVLTDKVIASGFIRKTEPKASGISHPKRDMLCSILTFVNTFRIPKQSILFFVS
jgi:hypothetical protein